MAPRRDYEGEACSLALTLEVVGERWTFLILRDMVFGVTRFNDLQAHLDVPRAVLADRLAALERAGVTERRPYAPGRDEHVLTDAGLELWPVVHRLMRWGDRHLRDDGPLREFSHAACGTTLDEDAACPRCGVTPPATDTEMRPGPGRPRVVRTDEVSKTLRQPRRLLSPVRAAAG